MSHKQVTPEGDITKTSSLSKKTEWVKEKFKIKPTNWMPPCKGTGIKSDWTPGSEAAVESGGSTEGPAVSSRRSACLFSCLGQNTKESDDSAEKLIDNAFGEIDFLGYGKNIAKYIAVEKEPNMADMEKLMLDIWALDKPKLVITVYGGDLLESSSDKCNNPQLINKVREGLKNAVKITGAWIITDGTRNGVTKHVGEAMKEFRRTSGLSNPAVAIGIAPWGCIQDRDSMVSKEKDTLNSKRLYKLDGKPDLRYPDPYHSHFILIDDGAVGQFGAEREFRAKLEKILTDLAKTETKMKEAKSGPIVLIVFGGDIKTLETVVEATKNNTPAIIVKGSGGIADILASVATGNIQKIDDLKKQGVDSKQLEEYKKIIKTITDPKSLLSVYEMGKPTNGSDDFDVFMLKALLKANRDSILNQIHLTLAWNRIDVAKSEIFSDDEKWSDNINVKQKDRHSVMTLALQSDNAQFVQLFLDHGVSLREFLTFDKLLELYDPVTIPEKSLLRKMFDKEISLKCRRLARRIPCFRLCKKDLESLSLQDVGEWLTYLTGDYFQDYTEYTKTFKKLNEEKRRKPETEMSVLPPNRAKIAISFENPARHLFIWSLLLNRQDLAKLFWSEGKDAIASALIGNHILTELFKKPANAELIKGIQKDDVNDWSTLARDVLEKCFSNDKRKTENVLVRKLSSWSDATCMVIATNAYNQEFISKPACQSLIKHAWEGKKRNQKTEEVTEDKATWTDKLYNRSKAPKNVAVYNLITYLGFLIMYSYMMIVSFNPKFSVEEILLIVWVAAITVEELRQMWILMQNQISLPRNTRGERTFLNFVMELTYRKLDYIPCVSEPLYMKWNKIAKNVYFLSAWNILDFFCIVTFYVGMILRSVSSTATFETARVILALNLWLFGLRLLQIFCVFKKLGATLVMISRLLWDLGHFLVILMTFVISYGIASYSVLYPNSPFTWDTINAVIRRPYWNIYGELFLEDIEGEICTNGTAQQIDCPYPLGPTDVGRIAVPIMMGINMLVVNVLLMNLLIAMFSDTFKEVKIEANNHWLYQRFLFIHEYCTRPSFVPPFNLLFHFVYPLFYRCKCLRDQNPFCPEFSPADLIPWEERIAGAFYWNKSDQSTRTQRQDDEVLNLASETRADDSQNESSV